MADDLVPPNGGPPIGINFNNFDQIHRDFAMKCKPSAR